MATQRLLSIVSKEGKVLVKIVVGCEGYNIPKLKKLLRKEKALLDFTVEDFINAAEESGCGCNNCLSIITPHQVYLSDEGDFNNDELPEDYKLYRETFNDPKFNPRWEQGTADYVEILKI